MDYEAMMHSLLIYKADKLIKSQTLALRKAISIGRHHLNDIQLPDPSSKVSRFHAALFCDADGNYFVQDLGSQNNTYINSNRRGYGVLNEGDKIGIGDYTLIFQRQVDKTRIKEPAAVSIDEDVEEIKTILSPVSFQWDDLSEFKHDPDALLLLYQINRIASLSQDAEDSLQLITEKLFMAFYPDRIFVALFNQYKDGITSLARYPDDAAEIRISRTMITCLRDEKKMVITNNALIDERFKRGGEVAKSILELQVKAAILVPLQWDGDIKGFLYLDSTKEGLFTERDLRFLSLIGNDISSLLGKLFDYAAMRDEKIRLENRLEIEGTIIGISPKVRDVIKTIIERIAVTDVTVLITGETGAGKDLIAKVIHQNSKRKGRPFIEVNCAAIPDNLMESEMFGVIANYPGFHNRQALKGKFELANSGTIFLNEIGDLSQNLQAKLLQVFDQKSIWPLGANQPIPADIRIIAATNQDLKRKVREGKFREDLYERLNIFPLHLPPLRERKEDVPLLAGYFLYRLRNGYGKRIDRFSKACIEALTAYEWPRNVRELQHAIERAVILTDRALITPDLFDLRDETKERPKSLADVEREHIMKVLEHTKGNKEKACRFLGISKQTLYNKGKEYRLPGFEE